MTSGIFLFGKSQNDLSDFDSHILPYIRAQNCDVSNKQIVDEQYGHEDGRILLAVQTIAMSNLDNMLYEGLKQAYVEGEKRYKDNGGEGDKFGFFYLYMGCMTRKDKKNLIFEPYLKKIGVYSEFDAANLLFASVAQKYLMAANDRELDEYSGKLSNFGKKLSDIDNE